MFLSWFWVLQIQIQQLIQLSSTFWNFYRKFMRQCLIRIFGAYEYSWLHVSAFTHNEFILWVLLSTLWVTGNKPITSPGMYFSSILKNMSEITVKIKPHIHPFKNYLYKRNQRPNKRIDWNEDRKTSVKNSSCCVTPHKGNQFNYKRTNQGCLKGKK